MTDTWIKISARGRVEELDASGTERPARLAVLLACGLTEAVDVTRTLAMIVADGYEDSQRPVNPVAMLTAALLGPGTLTAVRGDAVLAEPSTWCGLAGSALADARVAVDLARSLRPPGAPPGHYQLPSAIDPALTVRFGWDRASSSFFLWVGDPRAEPADHVLWAGLARGELDSVGQLEARADGHLAVSPMLKRLLRLDRAVGLYGEHTAPQQALDAAAREPGR